MQNRSNFHVRTPVEKAQHQKRNLLRRGAGTASARTVQSRRQKKFGQSGMRQKPAGRPDVSVFRRVRRHRRPAGRRDGRPRRRFPHRARESRRRGAVAPENQNDARRHRRPQRHRSGDQPAVGGFVRRRRKGQKSGNDRDGAGANPARHEIRSAAGKAEKQKEFRVSAPQPDAEGTVRRQPSGLSPAEFPKNRSARLSAGRADVAPDRRDQHRQPRHRRRRKKL